MTSGSFKRRGHKKIAGTACIEPGEPEIEEAKKCRGFKSVTFSMCDTKTELDKQVGNVENILFRCSAARIGKAQKITSMKCASIFGAAINDFAKWNFNLTDYNCHIMFYLLGKSAQINLLLTNDSLHRRNIIHHGITTLRPTICHGLLREAQLDTGEIILDPMVGCGSIPIEGALCSGSRAYYIGSDIWHPAVRRTMMNTDFLNKLSSELGRSPLMIEINQMDCINMPYRDGAIDCIVTDLPFGKRIHDGMTGMNNRDLYTAVLKEFGRVCNSRCVVQTQDSRSLAFALTQNKMWKPASAPKIINQGGIRVGIWKLLKVEIKAQG